MNKKKMLSTAPASAVGASSILVIFVVLCLVTFSILSWVTAKSDKNLCHKLVVHTQQYYQGENKAYQKLEQIDALLSQCFIANSQTYFQAVEDISWQDLEVTLEQKGEERYLSYQEQIGENQHLRVQLQVQNPQQPQDGFYQIVHWQTVFSGTWLNDNTIPVLKE